MIAASGMSRESVEEAARCAKAGLRGEPASAALVFASGRPMDEAECVREITGASAVVGCTGGGVLTEDGEVEGALAVAVLVLGGDVAAAGAHRDGGGESSGYSLARDLLGRIAEPRAVVVLAEPAGFDAEPFFRGLEEIGGALPVVGGVAAGGPESGVSALALYGAFALETVITQCAAPLGPARLITEASGNRISRLEGRTPLEELRAVLGGMPADRRATVLRGLLAGIAPIVRKPDLERGDFMIRNLVEVDQESGAIGVGGRVAVGMKFAFHHRDAAEAEEDFRAQLERAKARLGGRRTAAGLYFNCMGRGRGLYRRENVDVSLIREKLGAFPLAGFHGNGELARSLLHNYTGVLALFVS